MGQSQSLAGGFKRASAVGQCALALEKYNTEGKCAKCASQVSKSAPLNCALA